MTSMQRRAFGRLAAASICAAALLFLAGCQATGAASANERLDQSTGLTLTTANEVMVFARTEPRYSRSARDYIYLGPVETNRQGLREHFLWVGIATTLDRGYLAPPIDLPESLQVMVQGEPMVFDLLPWTQTVPGLAPAKVYPTSVTLQGQLGARATRDQLQLLAVAAPSSIRVRMPDGQLRAYESRADAVNWTILGTRSD